MSRSCTTPLHPQLAVDSSIQHNKQQAQKAEERLQATLKDCPAAGSIHLKVRSLEGLLLRTLGLLGKHASPFLNGWTRQSCRGRICGHVLNPVHVRGVLQVSAFFSIRAHTPCSFPAMLATSQVGAQVLLVKNLDLAAGEGGRGQLVNGSRGVVGGWVVFYMGSVMGRVMGSVMGRRYQQVPVLAKCVCTCLCVCVRACVRVRGRGVRDVTRHPLSSCQVVRWEEQASVVARLRAEHAELRRLGGWHERKAAEVRASLDILSSGR